MCEKTTVDDELNMAGLNIDFKGQRSLYSVSFHTLLTSSDISACVATHPKCFTSLEEQRQPPGVILYSFTLSTHPKKNNDLLVVKTSTDVSEARRTDVEQMSQVFNLGYELIITLLF